MCPALLILYLGTRPLRAFLRGFGLALHFFRRMRGLRLWASVQRSRFKYRQKSYGPSGMACRIDPRCMVLMYRLLRRSRSEEHTSELPSRVDLVCRLLLE